MDKIKKLIQDQRILIILGILILIGGLTVLFFIFREKGKDPEEEIITYDHTEEEQELSDLETEFLTAYLTLSENEAGAVAHEAVLIYRMILDSDTDLINNDHSDLIKTRLRKAIINHYEYAGALSDEELNALSSGMTEILYTFLAEEVKNGIGEGSESEDTALLLQSLQDQIDDLSSQKPTIKIRVRGELSADTLLKTLNGLSEEELQFLAERLGFGSDIEKMLKELSKDTGLGGKSEEDVLKLIKEALSEYDRKHANELQTIETTLEKDLTRTVEKLVDDRTKNLHDGADGKNGANGTNGKDGKDGKNGADGKAGADGKNTYIAYAEDATGKGFSKTPTAATRYIGTCITQDLVYPEDPGAYTWSEYKDYIITYDSTNNAVIITN